MDFGLYLSFPSCDLDLHLYMHLPRTNTQPTANVNFSSNCVLKEK